MVLNSTGWDSVDDAQTFLATARAGTALPLPGSGDTSQRFRALRQMSAKNPSVGRLLEAHCDAQAIFTDANVVIPANSALAVWASSSISRVTAQTTRYGLLLNGTQNFCGGAGIIDGALMTVSCKEGERLVFVRMNQEGVTVDLSTWKTTAFSDASIGTVRLTNVEIADTELVGHPHFYSARPGFWWGAVGVAACWAGITDRVIDMQRLRSTRCDEIAAVSLGLQSALCWGIDASLDVAARIIDRRSSESAQVPALSARYQIAVAAGTILRSVENEAGPGPLAFNPGWVQAVSELRMALGQHHGDRDLRDLGNLILCT